MVTIIKAMKMLFLVNVNIADKIVNNKYVYCDALRLNSFIVIELKCFIAWFMAIQIKITC